MENKKTVDCPIHKTEMPVSVCIARQKILAEAPADGNKGEAYKIYRKSCGDCKNNDETCSMCFSCITGSNYAQLANKKDNCSNYAQLANKKDNCQCDFGCCPDRFVQDLVVTEDSCPAENRPAATPEPMSKPGVDDVLPEVIEDLKARDAVGIEEYKTTLQTHNGRDALNDAYQETLDKAMYLKQEIMQRGASFEDKIAEWANARGLYESATPYSQMKKLFEEAMEWFDEVKSGDMDAEMVELGDCLVVLVNMAKKRGYSLEQCGWMAYNKIKDRTGHMENGTFVKDSE